MIQETIFIKNRQGLNMSVRISKPKNASKLAFLEHGFSGNKNENHILIIEEELAKAGHIVVNFDAVDSINESEKSETGITFTSHYSDLEDIIEWASKQSWYQEPFTLAGHSMGACSVLLYAENFPSKVNLLLPISFPWLSGISKINQETSEELLDWKTKGYWDKVSKSSGKTLRVPYNFIEDLMNYDFGKKANKIIAKTILIIGDLENEIRLSDNHKLFDMLKCEKDFIILENTPHCTATTIENAENFRKSIFKFLDALSERSSEV